VNTHEMYAVTLSVLMHRARTVPIICRSKLLIVYIENYGVNYGELAIRNILTRTCPFESGWTYTIRDNSHLEKRSNGFLTITKPLSSTFYYAFYHDFAKNTNNLSTKNAKSAPAWLA